MQKFISCDWGTSVLRVRLVDKDTTKVLATSESLHGISETFELWKKRNEPERLIFYQSVLQEEINKIEKRLNISLNDVPVIISGMASSSIGMMELPYKQIPFAINADELNTKLIDDSNYFKHQTVLISGIRTGNDVMRGEEIQLMGCITENHRQEQLFIFPGTHSKHVLVKDGTVVDFKTYMTGEFFELLSKKSILSNDMEENIYWQNNDHLSGFEKGVSDSSHSNLLHSSFLVRTNHLFHKLSKQENYFYLSGLLIGTELKEVVDQRVVLVCNKPLNKFYKKAFEILNEKNSFLEMTSVSEPVVKGQLRIYNKLFYSSNTHTKT